MFGPGSIEAQEAHAEAFVALALEDGPVGARPFGDGPREDPLPTDLEARPGDPPPGAFLDLGSGGGLPGLVLALRSASRGTLLDAQERRGAFLTEAVEQLGLATRIEVVAGRAENIARDPQHRGRYGLVVARSFAGPAVTAECATGFLSPGGRLVVSEPPGGDPSRWSSTGLADLGFSEPRFAHAHGASAALLDHPDPPSDRWPRRPGIPSKRPAW